jgi:hypothetical protein
MEALPAEHAEKPVSLDVLTHEAPFLIEKLLNDAMIESMEEGEQLFTEVKRWMLMVHNDRSKTWEMYSLRIDAVWHQFILFTDEYMKFCECYFGVYFSHSPGYAPDNKEMEQPSIGSFSEFKQRYETIFGIELPDVWYDERSVNLHRRLLNDNAGKLFLEEKDELINMVNSDGKILLTINLLARDAIVFIAATKAFYVRELPGDLTDEEKILLAHTLVEFNILRVAS